MHEVKIEGEIVTLAANFTDAVEFVAQYAFHGGYTIKWSANNMWENSTFILIAQDGTTISGEMIHITGKEYFD